MADKKDKRQDQDHSDMPMYDETKAIELDTCMKLPTEEAVENAKDEVDGRKM